MDKNNVTYLQDINFMHLELVEETG